MPPAIEVPAVAAALDVHGFRFVRYNGGCSGYRCATPQGEEWVLSGRVIGSAPEALEERVVWLLIVGGRERRHRNFESLAGLLHHIRGGGSL